MKIVPILFGAMTCAFSALAQDAPKGASSDAVSTASVSLQDCRRLLKHTPRPDVAYQPGVDVRGKPVVPAEGDAPLGGIKIPDEIVIDFGFDFAGRYGFEGTGLQTATAGILTINYDLALGGLMVNGKPLNKDDSRAVAKACAMMLKDADGAARREQQGQ